MRQEPDPKRSPRPSGSPGVPPELHSEPNSEPNHRPMPEDPAVFDTELDAELASGLKGLFHDAEPPESLKARLQAEAERRFGVPELAAVPANTGPPWRFLRGAAWASGLAAAAAALFLVLQIPAGDSLPETKVVATAAPETEATGLLADARDVDQSGKVDIFDAYLVARATTQGASTAGMPDLDGDGRVTRADADRIARFAVEVIR